VQAALENVALWHERDISHSSVERVILPDATILCDFMLHRISKVIDGLQIYPDRMLHNMELTGGLIYSQAVLLALTEGGMNREDAYAIVQRNSMKSWAGEGDFRTLLSQDEELTARLSAEALGRCFEPQRFLKHLDRVFERVFEA
jgi:adenylosuccinate lyase